MTLSNEFLLLAGIALLLLSFVIVYISTYTKEKFDTAKLKQVLTSKEESILEQQHKEKPEEKGKESYLDTLQLQLWQAGWYKMTPTIYFLIVTFSALLFVGGFYLIFENILALFIGAFIGAMIPFYVLGFRMASRTKEFNEALSEAMSVIVRMMRNGVGFEVALKRSIEISQSVLFQELFNKFIAEKDLIGEKRAFDNMYKKVYSAELKIFGLAIGIGKSSGGKFSTTIEKLDLSIKQRVTLQRKVTVATREAKVGSFMIVGLLVFIFMILDTNFEGKIIEHFFHTAKGKLEILVVFMWVGMGLLINERLTRVR